MDVAVGVGVARLQREDMRVGRGVELDDRLHGQRPVDEVRRLVVHVLYVDDDSLIVSVCVGIPRITFTISLAGVDAYKQITTHTCMHAVNACVRGRTAVESNGIYDSKARARAP